MWDETKAWKRTSTPARERGEGTTWLCFHSGSKLSSFHCLETSHSNIELVNTSHLLLQKYLIKTLHLHSSVVGIKLSQTAIHLIFYILNLQQYLKSNSIQSCLLIFISINSITRANLTFSETTINHILSDKLPFNFLKAMTLWHCFCISTSFCF